MAAGLPSDSAERRGARPSTGNRPLLRGYERYRRYFGIDYLFDEDLVLVAEDGFGLVYRSKPIWVGMSGPVWVNNHAHVLRPVDLPSTYLAARIECETLAPLCDRIAAAQTHGGRSHEHAHLGAAYVEQGARDRTRDHTSHGKD